MGRPKSPRHEVISLRLSEARLELLERYRRAFAEELGRDVSLSEAAFLALEDRATAMDRATARAELLKTPTESLFAIRQQWASRHALSAAQWDVLAEYVRVGVEESRQDPPAPLSLPSRDSYAAVLDAFRAVYQHRGEAASRHIWAYFGNLGGFLTTTDAISDRTPDQQEQLVLAQLAKRRDRLRTADRWERPGNIGHCFWLAVRDEGVDSVLLDQLLAPSWPVLWRLAARGHWIRHDHQPVRIRSSSDDAARPSVSLPPPMTAGAVTLSFTPTGDAEFVTAVGFGQFGLDIHDYPELLDFHAMVTRDAAGPWLGRHYSMTVDGRAGMFRVRSVQRQVHFDLSKREWTTLRDLVRRAWQTPGLSHWLSELQQQYGEHG
jgi:hypothetical protein